MDELQSLAHKMFVIVGIFMIAVGLLFGIPTCQRLFNGNITVAEFSTLVPRGIIFVLLGLSCIALVIKEKVESWLADREITRRINERKSSN